MDALAQVARPGPRCLPAAARPALPAYNSNGLWLTEVNGLGKEAAALVAEGGFSALKIRLGRDRLDDDLAAIAEIAPARAWT